MQAIQTKFIPATDTKPARVKAFCERGSVTVDSEATNRDTIHRFAVKKLIEKFCQEDLAKYGTPIEQNPWNRPFVSGGVSNGEVHIILAKYSLVDAGVSGTLTYGDSKVISAP